MGPPTTPFYLASADLFSSGRDELVTRCKSEECELEMHLTHPPDTVGYNAECCPVWSFILMIPRALATTERGSHCIITRQKKTKIRNSKCRFPHLHLLSHRCENHLLAPARPCEKGSFSEARAFKVKSPSYS